MKGYLPRRRPRPPFGELFLERAGLLKHHDIGVQRLEVAVDAFADGCSEAVHVP